VPKVSAENPRRGQRQRQPARGPEHVGGGAQRRGRARHAGGVIGGGRLRDLAHAALVEPQPGHAAREVDHRTEHTHEAQARRPQPEREELGAHEADGHVQQRGAAHHSVDERRICR
jgi:hypothetical protein